MGPDPEQHPIIPDDFVDVWGGESVADALRIAEQAPTTTPDDERDRCPYCDSVSIRRKRLKRDHPQRKPGKMTCPHCSRHFNQPADETTIPMTSDRADPFEWIEEPTDTAERGFTRVLRGVDDEQLTEIVLRVYRPWTDAGPSYRQLAAILPYGRKFIGERVRAWKAGDDELRALVPDPTADPTPSVDADGATAVATDGGRASRWDAFGSD